MLPPPMRRTVKRHESPQWCTIGCQRKIRTSLFLGLVYCAIIGYFMIKSRHLEISVKNHVEEKCERCRREVARLHLSITGTQQMMNNSTAKNHEEQQQNALQQYQLSAIGKNNSRDSEASDMPPLYVITPTYSRGTQKPDLTRLAQTLMLVPKLHWIVVEDASVSCDWVEGLLYRTGIKYTHLHIKTPPIERRFKVRGCAQRNLALKWIKNNVSPEGGVIYFADDDNAYDIRLFAEIRTSSKVGIVPTGNLARTGMSSPVIKNGKIVGFIDVWKGGRRFPVEMASLGININFWLKRGAPFFSYKKAGFMETRLLESMGVTLNDLEPKASGCTKIYTWHTNTVAVATSKSYSSNNNYKDTNVPLLATEVDFG